MFKSFIYTNRLRPLTAFIRGAIFLPGDIKEHRGGHSEENR